MATQMNFFTAQEEERSKIKETAHKKDKRQVVTRMVALGGLMLVPALFLTLLFLKNKTPTSTQSEAASVAQLAAQATSKPEPTPEPVATPDPIPRDAWYLALVNPENPLPADFTVDTQAIDPAGYTIDKRAAEDYDALLQASLQEGLKLKIASSYRSYERQETLFRAKVRELAANLPAEEAERVAATYVAKPGTSEHNLGLALDIVATYNQRMEADYEETPECRWLAAHAWEYGFILRYPKEKQEITGVVYEPWHYRYVGKEQAARIHESGLCLEEYLAV